MDRKKLTLMNEYIVKLNINSLKIQTINLKFNYVGTVATWKINEAFIFHLPSNSITGYITNKSLRRTVANE